MKNSDQLANCTFRREVLRTKRHVMMVLLAIAFAYMSLTGAMDQFPRSEPTTLPTSSQRTTATDIPPSENCTPAAIDEFPPDLFTNAQRQQGYVAVHVVASIYMFYCLAAICDDYFVPAIERICDGLHLSSDVAGATFMAIGTSSPEFFTNVIGTFVTKGDLGVGTVVGSAVFNILGVCACCGIAAKAALPLEWYPLTRDCLFYSFSALSLILLLGDRMVHWYEALALVVGYLVYIFVMYKNAELRQWAEKMQTRVSFRFGGYEGERVESDKASTETTPLLSQSCDQGQCEAGNDQSCVEEISGHDGNEAAEWSLTRIPWSEGVISCVYWFVTWPSRFVFAFTVPDCRNDKMQNLYPLTFIMCMCWIGILSYLVAWTVTVIGHTMGLHDRNLDRQTKTLAIWLTATRVTVAGSTASLEYRCSQMSSYPEWQLLKCIMGLTFLAAGASVPEVVSSVIVCRQGLGTMSISNSIGSNTFDILMCLGLPWLIRCIQLSSEPVNYVQINSAGLKYSTITLLVSLILLYSVFACNRFVLDRKVGLIALTLYCAFLVIACLFELNVFFVVNLPMCDSDG